MTPAQEQPYARLCEMGYEYDYTETDGSIFVTRWDRSVGDTARKLDTAVIGRDGHWYGLAPLTAQIRA